MTEERKRRSFVANADAEVADGSQELPKLTQGPDLLEAFGLNRDEVLHVKAKSLVGETFTIYGANQFPSTQPNQERDPFYCLCHAQGEWFSVVLGGKVVVEDLEAWADTGARNPLQVTIGFEQGGDYGGYYVFAKDQEASTPAASEEIPF